MTRPLLRRLDSIWMVPLLLLWLVLVLIAEACRKVDRAINGGSFWP